MMRRTQFYSSNIAKNIAAIALLSMLATAVALADETIYHIFADGLACEQCATTIDEQLRTIEGVERVGVLPEKGVINVRMADGHNLVEKQVSKIITDAGVKFRGIEQHPAAGGDPSAAADKLKRQENSL